MKSNVMMTRFLTFLLVFSSQAAMAKASKAALARTVPISIPRNELGANITSKDVEKVIPMDMRASDDANYVAQQIGDRALQLWFDRPEVRSSAFGRAATAVETATKTEIELGGKEPNDTQHKFTFQVLALQAMTRFQYTGWLNAAMNYDARMGATIVELSEKVWENKDVVVSHRTASGEGFSSVGLRWGF